ncbi:MAG: Mpv17/PMP22 family protein, partial [Dehalobacterium sp.]
FTSLIMNTTFGPVMMVFHRFTDTYIALKYSEKVGLQGLDQVMKNIEWSKFFNFVILRTIPFFWIPAHTITFLVPPEYRVLLAAFLSIALGVILSFKKRNKLVIL